MLRQVWNDLEKGELLWCGPASVSAITGIPASVATDEIISLLQRRGKTWDGGCDWEDVVDCCRARGYRFCLVDEWQRVRTLRNFSLAIVDNGGHFIVTNGLKMVDTGNQRPVPLMQTRFYNAWAKYHFEIKPPASTLS